MFQKLHKFLLRHELLIIILCLVTLVRLPSLIEPYSYGDEGIYLTLGNGIRHGLTLYRDIHDNKPPGIYYLAALAGSLFWFRMLLLGWNLASICVFAWIAKKIIGPIIQKPLVWKQFSFPRPSLVTLSILLFAFLPFSTEGNVANGELFMVLPVLIGFALLLRRREEPEKRRRRMLCALAGISFSLGFLIKIPAGLEAMAAGLFFFFYSVKAQAIKEKIANLVKGVFSLETWVFAAFFVLPILMTIAYYASIGAGKAYVGAALLQNVGYLSSWSTGNQQADLAKTGLGGRTLGLAALTVVLLFSSPLLTSATVFTLLWFGFALFGALLSQRPYPHYLMQVVAPVSLMIPLFFRNLKALQGKKLPVRITNLAIILVGVLILGASIVIFKFWNYPISPYFQNYFKFVTGQISKDQYLSSFEATLPEQYQLAALITNATTPEDRIFIWGDLPSLYALTRRLPPGRFTAAYHVKDFNGFDETLAAIVTRQPKFILIDKRTDPFPHLDGILAEEYVLVYQSKIFTLYRRLNP